MDITTIYKEIVNRNYLWCKVMSGKNVKLVLSNTPYTPKTSEEIVKDLREYFNDFPGTYKILLKSKPTDQNTKTISYDGIAINDFGNNESLKNSDPVESKDIRKLKEQWEKEFLAKMVLDKKKNDVLQELAKQKVRTNELDMFAGKLSYLLNAIFPNLPTATGNLGNTKSMTIMTEPKPLDQFTPQDKQNANEALMRILSVTNPDFLLEMAKKLQAKPEMINTLKSVL